MPFPQCYQRSTQDGLLFLALCSMRSLLNRIHHTIYAAGAETKRTKLQSNLECGDVELASPKIYSSESIVALKSVIKELIRQLDWWYQSLPEEIKPELSPLKPCGVVQTWLRSRYWSALHIITRVCLVHASSGIEMNRLPAFVMEYAQTCIKSCRNFIINASQALVEPTQYTWMIIQA